MVREMVGKWLPTDDTYSGFNLSRIGHSPEFERKQIENILIELGIVVSDSSVINTFQIIERYILFLKTEAKQDLSRYEDSVEPIIGTTYPLLIYIAQKLAKMLLSVIMKKGVNKSKQIIERWLKNEEDIDDLECPDELTKEECEILERILQKSRDNEKFANEIKAIFSSWNI